MVSKFVRFLGSVRLAVPLLVAIAVILVGATLLESQVGSATIQREVYKSLWFGALMFLLATNLMVSTLTRYPWRGARKVGFALTHLGLVVLIAGSAAVIHLGTEGMMLVRTDGMPRDEIRVEGDLLNVVTPDHQQIQSDVFVKADGSIYPKQVGTLSLLGYSKNSKQTVAFQNDGTVPNRAVHLSMYSDRMGQTLTQWLATAPNGYQQMDLGPATLDLVQAKDEAELKQFLEAPATSVGEMGVLQIQQGRQDKSFDVQSLTRKPQTLSGGIAISVQKVWPDFRLNGKGDPDTASPQYLNPALQVSVRQGDRQEQWYVFSNPEFPAMRSSNDIDLANDAIAYQAPSALPSDFFRVIEAPDQQLYYAANSSQGFLSGSLSVGDSVTPGWADFSITLEDSLDHARIERTVEPVMPVAAKMTAENPAIHVALPTGQDYWLPWGEPQTLATAEGSTFAAFSPKILQLPFQVELNDFIVERNEGSESVAMWISDVNLVDGNGQKNNRRVWMNHPTWFEGWKLAQASWNPGDLSQSTLQIKREPWWVTALTWLGSLLVVCGIATMFYGRSIAKKLKSTQENLKGSEPRKPKDSAPATA
ncbi:MAG: cytochrome c biogenesis protein ResB [Acaryochloridaceae cyanobacterium RL_2_7]|nr:cytochrome c biogenesis protein ResB [Acaryochloridaceae cyanobacterium RL_2_7]